jgi:hypothetical protein
MPKKKAPIKKPKTKEKVVIAPEPPLRKTAPNPPPPTEKVVVDSNLLLQPDQEPGFYAQKMRLKLKTKPSDSSTIYYTTDGSPANRKGKRYEEAIELSSTTVVRAVAYRGNRRSVEWVGTYFFGEDKTPFPVLSLSVQGSILFDPITGLFQKGPKAAKTFPYGGANYYSTKEFICHVEFFESDKKRVFHSSMGFKIFGGTSRIFAQKSLALYARGRYGKKSIKHEIFPDRKNGKYQRLVLRNSGSDFGETHFRDAFITSLGREMGLEVQAYRPALVFINGRYWGVYNLREKITKHYFENNFNIHRDSVDLLEHQGYVQAGSKEHYQAMQAYMRKHDLAEPEHFAKIATMMDVDNFMEYQIMQIYIDNQDAGGNIKYWRPRKEGGRWRWILFDTDYGFAHFQKDSYRFNSLAFHTAPNGPAWPNPPWSTFNLRMLLKNKEFQKRFILRFADRINTLFDSSYLLPRIDSFCNRIYPEMPRHWVRWKLDTGRFHYEIAAMKEFARRRPAYMRRFLQEKFPYIGAQAELRVELVGGGKVLLNEAIWISGAFQGIYFEHLPLKLEAKTGFNARFSHWEVDDQIIKERVLQYQFKGRSGRVRAVFEEGQHPLSKRIVINEISHRDSSSGDWIEFYNNSSEDLALEGWKLRDKGQKEFVFPDVQLKAGSYLVVCQKLDKFKAKYPDVENAIGDLGFGLDKRKERLELYDRLNEPVDSVGYDLPKGQAQGVYYLALRNFDEDNGNFEHWKIQEGAPSPGKLNQAFVAIQRSSNEAERSHYWKILLALLLLAFFLVAGAWWRMRSKTSD